MAAVNVQSNFTQPDSNTSVFLSRVFIAQDGAGNPFTDGNGDYITWELYLDDTGQIVTKKATMTPPV